MSIFFPPTKSAAAAVTRGAWQRMQAFAASAYARGVAERGSRRWNPPPIPPSAVPLPDCAIIRDATGRATVSHCLHTRMGISCLRITLMAHPSDRGMWMISYVYTADGNALAVAERRGDVIDRRITCCERSFMSETRGNFYADMLPDHPLTLTICSLGKVGVCTVFARRV